MENEMAEGRDLMLREIVNAVKDSGEKDRNTYTNVTNHLGTVFEESSHDIKDEIKRGNDINFESLIRLKDSIVKKLTDLSSDITRYMSSVWRDISRPIQDFLTPMYAMSNTIMKLFRYIKGDNKFSWNDLKDKIEKILVAGTGILAIVLGVILEKIKSPITVMTKIIEGLNVSMEWFKTSILNTTNSISRMTSTFAGDFKAGMSMIWEQFQKDLGIYKEVNRNSLLRITHVVDDIEDAILVQRSGLLVRISGIFEKIWSGISGIKMLFGQSNMFIALAEMVSPISVVFKAIFNLFKNFGWVMGTITGILPAIEAWMPIIKGFLKSPWIGRIFWPLQIIMSVVDFVNGFINTRGNIGDKIMGGIQGVFKGLIEGVSKPLEWLLGLIGLESKGLSDKIVGIVQPLFNILLSVPMMFINFIRGFFEGDSFIDGVRKGLTKAFGGFLSPIVEFIDGLAKAFGINNLLEMVRTGINLLPDAYGGTAVKSMFNKIIDGIKTKQASSVDSSSKSSTGGVAKGAAGGNAVTPASPAVGNYSGGDAGNVSMGGQTTNYSGSSMYTPSEEAKRWFTDMAITQQLLREWLSKGGGTSSSGVGNMNNVNNSVVQNTRPIGDKRSPNEIPTDIENFGLLLLTKTWGLS